MKTRIIIVGPAASGKSYLKNKFIEKGFIPSINTTTRPPRKGEVSGIDYYFLTDQMFTEAISWDRFLEYKNFNGWYYGTPWEEWEFKDIFIMTPGGVADIPKEDRASCFIIYLDIDAMDRMDRLYKRNDADSTKRRMQSDQEDFLNFKDYDLKIKNPNF